MPLFASLPVRVATGQQRAAPRAEPGAPTATPQAHFSPSVKPQFPRRRGARQAPQREGLLPGPRAQSLR